MVDGKDYDADNGAEALAADFHNLRVQIMDEDLPVSDKAAKLFLLGQYHKGSSDKVKFDDRSGLEVSNPLDSTKEAIVHGTFGVSVTEFADQQRVTIVPLDPEKEVLDGQRGSFGTDYRLRDDAYEQYFSLKEEVVEHVALKYE